MGGMVDTRNMTRRLPYVPQLNGLRAVAIGLVVFLHGAGGLGKGGWIGVDVFFVLSGFLITSLLMGEASDSPAGKFDLARFYLRRISRLWPAYVVFIGAALVYAGAFKSTEFASWRHQLFTGITYRMNFWNINHVPHDGVGQIWSLCMEEQFYLVWPLLLLAMSRLLKARPLMWIVSGLVLASIAENVILAQQGVTYRRLYFGPDTNAFSLLLGCLAGLAYTAGYLDRLSGTRFIRWYPYAFMAALGIWSLTISNLHDWVFAGPVELMCTATAVAIVCLVIVEGGNLWRLLGSRLFVWVGVLSYSLYLWNELALSVGPLHGASKEMWALRLGLLIGLPVVSYYIVERPGLVLKDRYETFRRTPRLEES